MVSFTRLLVRTSTRRTEANNSARVMGLKLETRNSKFETNSKFQLPIQSEPELKQFEFRIWKLFRISNFEFRTCQGIATAWKIFLMISSVETPWASAS